jgi:hypothetical protein
MEGRAMSEKFLKLQEELMELLSKDELTETERHRLVWLRDELASC